jgi:hypothetical protein
MNTPIDSYEEAIRTVANAICRHLRADPDAISEFTKKPNWKTFEPQARVAVDALGLKEVFQTVYDAERLYLDYMVAFEGHEITNQLSSTTDKAGYIYELCKKMADPRSRN